MQNINQPSNGGSTLTTSWSIKKTKSNGSGFLERLVNTAKIAYYSTRTLEFFSDSDGIGQSCADLMQSMKHWMLALPKLMENLMQNLPD